MDKLIGTGGTLVKFIDDARAAINAADLPATTKSARDAAWTARASLPTISGDRCRPFGSRSTSSASLRGCSRSSRSPWSMARGPRRGKANESRVPAPVRACLC